VCHDGYITGHNSRTKTPDWVIERLTSEKCGVDVDTQALFYFRLTDEFRKPLRPKRELDD